MAVTQIQAPQYQSQFVGADLDAYGNALQQLSNRYQESFLRDHELGSHMRSAVNNINPEDRAMFMDEVSSISSSIKDRANQGDYESMQRQTMADALEFAEKYQVFESARASKDAWLQNVANSNWAPEYKQKLMAMQGNAPSVVRDEQTGQLVNNFGTGLQFAQDANFSEIAEKYSKGFNASGISSNVDQLAQMMGSSAQSLALTNATDAQLADLANGLPVKVMVGSETIEIDPSDVTSAIEAMVLGDSDAAQALTQRAQFIQHDNPELSDAEAFEVAKAETLDPVTDAIGKKIGFKKQASSFKLDPLLGLHNQLQANAEKLQSNYIAEIVDREGLVSNIEGIKDEGVDVGGRKIKSFEKTLSNMAFGGARITPTMIVGSTTPETITELPESLQKVLGEYSASPQAQYDYFMELSDIYGNMKGASGGPARGTATRAFRKLDIETVRAMDDHMENVKAQNNAVSASVLDKTIQDSIEAVNSTTHSNFKYDPTQIYQTKDGEIQRDSQGIPKINKNGLSFLANQLDKAYRQYYDSRSAVANTTFSDDGGKMFNEKYGLPASDFPISTSFHLGRQNIDGNIVEGTLQRSQLDDALPEDAKYKGAQAIGISGINGGDEYFGTTYELIYDVGGKNPREFRVRATADPDGRVKATTTYKIYKSMMDASKSLATQGVRFDLGTGTPKNANDKNKSLEFEVTNTPSGPRFDIYNDGELVNSIGKNQFIKGTSGMMVNFMLSDRGRTNISKTDSSGKTLESVAGISPSNDMDSAFIRNLVKLTPNN